MKIGVLIPCTSNKRDWANMMDTYLLHFTLKTFLATCCTDHQYVFYIGHDADDRIFADRDQHRAVLMFKKAYPIDIKFVVMDAQRGHWTKMWNQLFQQAYSEECEYFYQCGDDIIFHTRGWVSDSIRTLQRRDNIGITGPRNNNGRILTQGFVSRRHMEIFGYFFPEEIFNWCCDDWYNWVYQPDHLYILENHFSSNQGGQPRYDVNDNPTFYDDLKKNTEELRSATYEMALNDRNKVVNYVKQLKGSALKHRFSLLM